MASRPSVPASYKKLKGTLSVKSTQLEWIPDPGQTSAAPVVIQLGLIRNLQATPAHNPKVMIKVFVAKDPGQEPVASVFAFTSGNARQDCDTIKEAIQMAIAERNRPKTVADVLREGEEGLLRNTDLQMSVLKQDTELSKMFRALVIEGKQLTDQQFWRARVHLLRAHAIERTQQRGPYNVLAVLKPKTQDGMTKVSLSAERIRDIFEQHPLVKRVYDENVPKLSEDEFWSRFFMSRLKKKLSGEKIRDTDATDDIMDKYLRPDYDQLNKKRARQEEVPNFIDIEGNEEHVSKKTGNMPDRTMRPSEDVPIMHTINSLSRRMVDSVTQEEGYDQGHTDDEYIAQLRLGDLEPERPDDHVVLNISNRDEMDIGVGTTAKTTSAPRIDPLEALRKVQNTIQSEEISLLKIGRNSEALSSAARQITSDIKSQAHIKALENRTEDLGLSDGTLSQLYLTHSASVEFLRQFWITYLSKSNTKKKELDALAQSLRRTQERMDAVRAHAVNEGGEKEGKKVMQALQSVSSSIKKAISLWERMGIS